MGMTPGETIDYHVFDASHVLESEKNPSKIKRYGVYLKTDVDAQMKI